MTILRQGSFTQKVVSVWSNLPGKVEAAETVHSFKFELDEVPGSIAGGGLHGY